jgi:DMSO reductase anchor subunit
MRPAFSVILFSTTSGAGFGLLALVGGLAACGGMVRDSVAPILLGTALATFGMLAATGHLGRPRRMLWAFTQWRTSWLSREAVAAVATLASAAMFAACSASAPDTPACRALGLAVAALAGGTVACTAMIYASLRPIPQWHNGLVLPCYLALAAITGGLALLAFGPGPGAAGATLTWLVIATILIGGGLKAAYWRCIDTLPGGAATGLEPLGRLRLLDPALTSGGFGMTELGGGIAGAPAWRRRRLAAALLFALPLALTAPRLVLPPQPSPALAIVAAISAAGGVLIERWLFFAEARHASRGWLHR